MRKILYMLIFALLCTGCAATGDIPMDNDIVNQELYGISFNYRSGMLYGEDYSFSVRQDVLQYANFFEDGEEIEVEDVELTNEEWTQISSLTSDLLVFLAPYTQSEKDDDLLVLDGDSFDFQLQWRDSDGGIQTLSYVFPWDQRFETLKTYLMELAHPINRTIEIYDPPVLTGFELVQDGTFLSLKDYAYRLRLSSDESKCNVTVEQRDGFLKQSDSYTMTVETWNTFAQEVEDLQYLSYANASDHYLVLIYDKGHRKVVKPSEAVHNKLLEMIENWIQENENG